MPSKGALRVVAGSAAGRRFDAPAGSDTRPTSDRVREAVFNALDSLGAVEGAQVLDAFAGSGALGIEALSRGAAHATFIDADATSVEVVGANLRALGLDGRARVAVGDALRAVGSVGPLDLVLLDPPYAFDRWSELLEVVAAQLSEEAVVVVESDREVALPPALRGIRSKTYGGTVVQFAVPSGAPT